MENLKQKLLSLLNPIEIIKDIFPEWENGKNVSCPFAEIRHEKSTDKNNSMSISEKGKFYCHSCDYKATSIIGFIMDFKNKNFKSACRFLYGNYIEPLVPYKIVKEANTNLLKNDFLLAKLKTLRGLDKKIVIKYNLGWRKNRLSIPIKNEFNFTINIRQYDLMKQFNSKLLSYAKGFGKTRLFPFSSMSFKTIYIFEGEMDTLLALQNGLNAITVTGGANTWSKEINGFFKDKNVVIVPDLDKIGLIGLKKKMVFLKDIVKSLGYILLPLKKKDSKDFTDYIMKEKHTIKDFLKLPIKTYKGKEKTSSGRDLVPKMLDFFNPNQKEEIFIKRAEYVFGYMVEKGTFFKNQNGNMFYVKYKGEAFQINIKSEKFLSYLSNFSPLLNSTTTSGKFVIQHIINKAFNDFKISQSSCWNFFDGKRLFLYAGKGEIYCIEKGKIITMKNAMNRENILLESPQHVKPVKLINSQPIQSGLNSLKELFLNNLAISNENRYLLLCWVLGLFFKNYVRNKPLMRLAAGTAYGKSTISKFLSVLIYGEELLHHSASTISSMYSMATEYPFLIFDNIETRNMTQSFEDFLLIAATGGMKTKRQLATNSSVILEKVDCLVLTNGIEPFTKHEILNRTLEINLDIDRYGLKNFQEMRILEKLKEKRFEILTSIVKILSRYTIPKIHKSQLQKTSKSFGSHSKERFNEYLGLMALILKSIWAFMPLKGYAVPDDLINYWLISQNKSTVKLDESTNDIVYFIDTFAKKHGKLLDTEIKLIKKEGRIILKGSTRDLLSDFRLLSRHLGIKCPWTNERQLGTRLVDASEILEKSGWKRKQKIISGKRIYEYIKKEKK